MDEERWTFRRWATTRPVPEGYVVWYDVDEEALAAELGIPVAAVLGALSLDSRWQLGPDGVWRAVPGEPA